VAKQLIDFGMHIDILTKDELDKSLAAHGDQLAAGLIRGIGYRRLPQLSGTAVSDALLLGTEAPGLVGPPSGYAWTIRRVYVNGLTAGSTPDVVQLFRNGSGSQPVWQISGSTPQQTFGRLEFVLNGGETLVVASVGTFQATGTITVSGELVEIPSEMLGKLA